MKLDMKSKKNKANSHRGRGKEIAYPDTSDGQKGTLLSMNVSDISNALKAGGIGKRPRKDGGAGVRCVTGLRPARGKRAAPGAIFGPGRCL